MLEKFLNKNVRISTTTYGSNISVTKKLEKMRRWSQEFLVEGIVTNIDSNFIEIDNNMVIQIKYIISIENI